VVFVPPIVAGIYQTTECVYSISKLGLSNISMGSGNTSEITLTATRNNGFVATNSYQVIFQLRSNGLVDLPQYSTIIPIAGSGAIDAVYDIDPQSGTKKYGISFAGVATPGLLDTGLELGPNLKKIIGNYLMPVGFIYSTNDISNGKDPATLFGGT
jgi:hypothetical protein